ncbi:MAG: hypothetical protein DWQ02_07555, partial [Bacteroidetes bacterium]
EDDAYNRGVPSKVIKVARLDVMPPVDPIMESVSPENGQMQIRWFPSASEDAIGQLLYKKTEDSDDEQWQLVDTLEAGQSIYLDPLVEIGKDYFYRLMAYDEANNLSDFSGVKQGRVPFPGEAVVVSNLSVVFDQSQLENKNLLEWEYSPINEQIANAPFVFEIYRSSGGNVVELLTSVEGETMIFEDREISQNVLYNYAVRIRFDNGWVGDLSEIKSIMVK